MWASRFVASGRGAGRGRSRSGGLWAYWDRCIRASCQAQEARARLEKAKAWQRDAKPTSGSQCSDIGVGTAVWSGKCLAVRVHCSHCLLQFFVKRGHMSTCTDMQSQGRSKPESQRRQRHSNAAAQHRGIAASRHRTSLDDLAMGACCCTDKPSSKDELLGSQALGGCLQPWTYMDQVARGQHQVRLDQQGSLE